MICNSISQYLKELDIWLNTPANLRNGEMLVLVKGEKVPFDEYINANPKPVYRRETKGNCDSSAIDSDIVPQNGSRTSRKN